MSGHSQKGRAAKPRHPHIDSHDQQGSQGLSRSWLAVRSLPSDRKQRQSVCTPSSKVTQLWLRRAKMSLSAALRSFPLPPS